MAPRCTPAVRFYDPLRLILAVRAVKLLQSPPPSLVPFLPAKMRPPNPAPPIELIDIRNINPLPISAIASAVRKTGRMVLVHEAGKAAVLATILLVTLGDELPNISKHRLGSSVAGSKSAKW